MENKELEKRGIAQYKELADKYNGADVAVVLADFKDDITYHNEEEGYIDTNYKDILVTFKVTDGKVELTDMVELYDDDDNFAGTIWNVKEKC